MLNIDIRVDNAVQGEAKVVGYNLLLINESRLVDEKVPKNERALFLSLQHKRIGVRAVEKLVKKYSEACIPLKHITPHKLRSTYGTNLYRETGDIYIVADVLGHKDVNTTKRHYAAINEQIKREASTHVNLRKTQENTENGSEN